MKAGAMKREVFLDRDGTVIVDHGYISDPAVVQLLPSAADSEPTSQRVRADDQVQFRQFPHANVGPKPANCCR